MTAQEMQNTKDDTEKLLKIMTVEYVYSLELTSIHVEINENSKINVHYIFRVIPKSGKESLTNLVDYLSSLHIISINQNFFGNGKSYITANTPLDNVNMLLELMNKNDDSLELYLKMQ